VEKMEKSIGVTEAREKLSEIVEKVQFQGDTFVISRHGKPAAAVVPMKVYEIWKRQREEFFDTVRKIQESNRDADPNQVFNDVLEAQKKTRSFDE
jgi:prevent-host-death family protein